jgi:hydroxyacylglutathione hydrolase
MHKNMRALNGTEFRSEQKADVLILDTRDPEAFENGFIPGSINIGLQGTFAVWVGTIIDIQTSLLLVTESGKEEESIRRLARVGYEKVLGYLKGGIASWTSSGETLDRIQSVTAEEFCSLQDSSEVIDVRKEGEYDNLHVKGARLIPLSELQAQLGVFDPKKQYLVHCAGGYRSMIASSILKKNGIHNFKNVLGGMAKIKEAGAAVEKLKSVNE